MVRFISSVLIFFLLLPCATQLLDLSCHNVKRKQFFELFEPQLAALSPIRQASKFYSRPLLVPASQETDEINATTDHCGATLLDIEPLPTLNPSLKIDVNLTDSEEGNLTIPASNLSENAAATPSESEPPIVSFEEWTKQKLEKEKLKHHSVTNGNQNNVDHLTPAIDKAAAAASTIETVSSSIEEKVQTSRVVHTIPLVVSKRNYASKECGAKVIGANEEAEKFGAILNDKEKDEYMRNACDKAKDKFVIIELCETIQPTSIELANFELFSSSPKNFRILGSERQPPVEWITLGEFEAQDTRDVQTFQIPQHNIYTKYLKLELLTHYGKEHYCTLSSFRVYGISMVDEYEAEATAAFGVTENAGAPMKVTLSDALSSDIPIEEPLITAPLTSPEVTEPPLETTLEIPPLDIVEPIPPPLAPWQIRDCLKCDTNHPKAVTAWLCYVFSPSVCSKRNIKSWKNGTVILSKGQTKFLKAVLQPRLFCSLQNVPMEKKIGEKPAVATTTVLPTKQEHVLMHTLETEVKKQTIIQQKQASNVPLPAATTNHKESVFLKLNKRLSNLELNISLSSQYLAELSNQYVKQTEENRKNHEKTSKYIEEAISRASITLSKQFGEEIIKIQKEVRELFSHFRDHTSSSNVPGPFEKGHPSGSLIIRFPVKEHCSSSEYDNIYLDKSDGDGLWTTQQLVAVIAVMQATTFGMMFVLQYLWKGNAQQNVVIISSDVDVKKIIAAEVQNELKEQQQKLQQHFMISNTTSALVLPNTSSSSSEHPTASTPSPPTATSSSPSKKRRKKKRNTNSANNFAIPSTDKWDSTSVSSNISAPSTSVCSSTVTSISSLLKKKGSTASRDSCFTSESIENVPSEQHLFPPYLTN